MGRDQLQQQGAIAMLLAELLKIISVLVLIPILMWTPVAGALSQDDLDAIYKNSVWYKQEYSSTGGMVPCSPSLTGSDNEERTWNYFRSRGLSAVQTAGIMGNFSQEDSFNPRQLQGGGESDSVPLDGVTGYGIAQWTFLTRQQNLDQFARDQNRPVATLDLQLDFAYKEMTESDIWDNMRTIQNVEVATRYFHSSFERSDDDENGIQERVDDAIAYLNLYGSGSGPGGGPDPTCPPEGSIGTSPDGFVFPLRTTEEIVRQGVNGQRWCADSQTSCHLNYNAADILVPTGTPVLAVRNGTITNIRAGPARLVLLADNGRSYYYTHMAAGSIPVGEGQSVQAGDVIGAVGNDVDGGGIRHLHIDELPRPPYDYRPDCSSAECQAYPFIDIQPELIAAFNRLP